MSSKHLTEPQRTTVTLDPDVLARTKDFGKARGLSFRESLNELVRLGLIAQEKPVTGEFLKIKPRRLGLRPGLSYDKIEDLIEFGEGPFHR
jgi:hypothetical protein